MANKVTNKPTSIEQLREYSKGSLVQLPNFGDGQEFYAYLKRPSMLTLVSEKKIPNSLLTTANRLFTNTSVTEDTVNDEAMLAQMYEVIDVLCEATFEEPSWKDLKDNNIELTDEQLMFVFTYSQDGVKKLEPFRGEQDSIINDLNVKEV